jgi:RNA polymerase sigma factor (sigma-70 family)
MEPGKGVRPGPPGSSPHVEAAGPGGNAGPGPLKGGSLKAEKPCESVRREGTVAGELDPSGKEDLELCRAVRDKGWETGGSEAFWTLWLKHEKWIWRTVRRATWRVCPSHVAKDVFEAAVLERVQLGLTQRVGRYLGEAPLRAFLKKVIANASIDQYRYYRARREDPLPEAGREPEDSGPEDDGSTEPGPVYRTRSFPGPEQVAAARERREILHVALRLVSVHTAASVNWAGALRRLYLEDMSGTEIAREMACTPDAVHKYLERGRKELRTVLRERFGIESIEDLIS